MFYLTVPLAILLISFAGITAIIWRKLPYMKKLTLESHDTGGNFIFELAPEARVFSEKIKLKEYKDRFLVELEKKKKRRSHRINRIPEKKPAVPATDMPSFLKPTAEDLTTSVKVKKIRKMSPEEIKQKEQELIVEIAKDPKNSDFYVQLGELYVKMNSLTDAKEAFETVLKLDSGNSTAKENLKKVSAKLKSPES